MNKVVFLKFNSESSWTSCSLLLDEIEYVYRLAFPETISIITVSENNSAERSQAIDNIIKLNPAIIVFADHRFKIIASWVKQIKDHPQSNKTFHWAIHTYGCFMGRTKEWVDLNEATKLDPVSIFCSSKAQQDAASHLFKNPKCLKLFRIPYMQKHECDPEKRKAIREKLNLSDDDIAIWYAGRISFQKNVHHLINLLHQYENEHQKKIKLFICGNPDDINPKESPHAYYLNYTSELFFESMSRANSKLKFVQYLGHLNRDEISDFAHGMDCSISLSTLEGEDYGRSLVESLCQGLPVIATKWGGHKDLEVLPQTKLVPLELHNNTLKLDTSVLYQLLHKLSPNHGSKINITRSQSHFAPEAAAIKLSELLNDEQPIGGMTKKAFIHILNLETPWKKNEFFINYEQVLQSYWS